MENITLGSIVSAIGLVSVIGGFFFAIFKWYKKNITDEFKKINDKLDCHIKGADKTFEAIESKVVSQGRDIEESKQERLILLKGQLACLEGLKQGGANGPVTRAIEEINAYLINKSHE